MSTAMQRRMLRFPTLAKQEYGSLANLNRALRQEGRRTASSWEDAVAVLASRPRTVKVRSRANVR